MPPTSSNFTRHSYGSDPAQFGELYLPIGTRKAGTIVVIHGGFWRSVYDLSLGRPLAIDLAARGWATWNLEYRRVDAGGGWPETFDDIAAGIDALAELDVDRSRVIAIGHSAGGQLATWAAGRAKLAAGEPGATPKVALTAVVSQAGVICLTDAANENVGNGAVPALLGGLPAAVPDRYALADPVRALPIEVPVLCVHSRSDDAVPFSQSERYVAAATNVTVAAATNVMVAAATNATVAAATNATVAAATNATVAAATNVMVALKEVPGSHLDLITVGTPAWQAVLDALPGLLR